MTFSDIEDRVYQMGVEGFDDLELENFLRSKGCWNQETAYEMSRVFLRGVYGEPRYLEDEE